MMIVIHDTAQMNCRVDKDCSEKHYCYQKRICATCHDCSVYNQKQNIDCAKIREDCGECISGYKEDPSNAYNKGYKYCIPYDTATINPLYLTLEILGSILLVGGIIALIFYAVYRLGKKPNNRRGSLQTHNKDIVEYHENRALVPKDNPIVKGHRTAEAAHPQSLKKNETRQMSEMLLPPAYARNLGVDNHPEVNNQQPVPTASRDDDGIQIAQIDNIVQDTITVTIDPPETSRQRNFSESCYNSFAGGGRNPGNNHDMNVNSLHLGFNVLIANDNTNIAYAKCSNTGCSSNHDGPMTSNDIQNFPENLVINPRAMIYQASD